MGFNNRAIGAICKIRIRSGPPRFSRDGGILERSWNTDFPNNRLDVCATIETGAGSSTTHSLSEVSRFLHRERRRIVSLHVNLSQMSAGGMASAMYQDGLLHALDDILTYTEIGSKRLADFESDLRNSAAALARYIARRRTQSRSRTGAADGRYSNDSPLETSHEYRHSFILTHSHHCQSSTRESRFP